MPKQKIIDQEKRRDEIIEKRTFKLERDKLFHQDLQDIEADLAGHSYLPYDQLFEGCTQEQIDWMLKEIRDDERREAKRKKQR